MGNSLNIRRDVRPIVIGAPVALALRFAPHSAIPAAQEFGPLAPAHGDLDRMQRFDSTSFKESTDIMTGAARCD